MSTVEQAQAAEAPSTSPAWHTFTNVTFGSEPPYRLVDNDTIRKACADYSRVLGNLELLKRMRHIALTEGLPTLDATHAVKAAEEAEWMAMAKVREAMLAVYWRPYTVVGPRWFAVGKEYLGERHVYNGRMDGWETCPLCWGHKLRRDFLGDDEVVPCLLCRGRANGIPHPIPSWLPEVRAMKPEAAPAA